jgi:hypothetical protein
MRGAGEGTQAFRPKVSRDRRGKQTLLSGDFIQPMAKRHSAGGTLASDFRRIVDRFFSKPAAPAHMA